MDSGLLAFARPRNEATSGERPDAGRTLRLTNLDACPNHLDNRPNALAQDDLADLVRRKGVDRRHRRARGLKPPARRRATGEFHERPDDPRSDR